MSWEVRQGDCLTLLGGMESESIQTCITSPPYWGLRDYGTAEWEGGEEGCDHSRHVDYGEKSDTNRGSIRGGPMGQTCDKCGAARIDSQLGLEPTPEQYVANMVEVFREVRRVLRADGTLWLNLGDSYAGSGKGPSNRPEQALDGTSPIKRNGQQFAAGQAPTDWLPVPMGLKGKDLVGIPWRVAFALQADGWYLRSDIIWAKPNPMPESVTDRPTKAHEYLFLLSKSPRYYYDAEAIREKTVTLDPGHPSWRPSADQIAADGRKTFDAKRDGSDGLNQAFRTLNPDGRNKRSVWEVTTTPYAEAHFATFPPKLIEPCILAGSSEGATVLDPFCGSGTTGVVALRHDRSFIGLELNPAYCEMARNRIRDDAPLFNHGLEVAA